MILPEQKDCIPLLFVHLDCVRIPKTLYMDLILSFNQGYVVFGDLVEQL